MYQIDFKNPAHIYFVGIGGISMSGLAEILREEGFKVSGSDKQYSFLTEFLENKGVRIFYGQRKENITPDIDCAIFTSAIQPDNPEYIAVKEQNIPYLSRAELLGQIMSNYPTSIAVSGTHGKTTTTSMICEILLSAKLDPTLSIGGILKSIDGNIHVGKSEYFVAEACEYTNSFLSLFPKIGIILNIEEDHLDFFKDLSDIRNSFHRFASGLPKDGTLIMNGDIENVKEFTDDLSCSVITIGRTCNCDYYYTDITYNNMGCPTFTLNGPEEVTQCISLSVPGEHNVYNAMAAIAVSDTLKVSRQITTNALLSFHGTNRRFEYKGNIGGVTIIDDYAHHPTEITATLKAASNYPHVTTWCVFQPHTYSRTKKFLKEFATALSLADKIILADIYASRENDTLGISSRDLQKEIHNLGKECFYFPSFDEIENFLLQNCINGDLLITMGAGDVVKIGEKLLGK